jgi:predicted metal-dependent hydrolase
VTQEQLPLDLFDDEPDGADEDFDVDDTGSDGAGVLTGTDEEPFTVEVIRSAKRKRTVGARLKSGVLTITVPSWMSKAEEDVWRDRFADRFRRRMDADRFDLRERADTLARRYDLPRPKEITWVDSMTARWGSCTPAHGTIRLSSHLAPFPDWVVDYVIVHELAHLSVPAHNEAFWKLVHRYPKAERAIGFLIAKSDGHEDID